MIRLEDELRAALNDRAPGHVDTSTWADAARARAKRHRARAAAAAGLGLAVLLAVGVGGFLSRQDRSSTMPVHPPPPSSDSYTALCAMDRFSGSVPRGGGPWSRNVTGMALCPDDPADPAWAQLPRAAYLTGGYMDGVAIGSGGPPVENCELGRPRLPGFRVVVRDRDNVYTSTSSSSQPCGGAQLAQSIAAALALEDYDTSTRPLGSGCSGMMTVETQDPPAELDASARVHVCVTANPYTEAEPSPLRYRPVRAVDADPGQRQALVDGLANSTVTRGKYTDCPWRNAAIKVITTSRSGDRRAVLLRCEQDVGSGTIALAQKLSTMPGTWPTLPPPAQAILEDQVGLFLRGGAATK